MAGPADATTLPRGTGHGNVWGRGVQALAATGEVKLTHRRAQVWFASGHGGLPPSAHPLVALLYEVGWRDAELRGMFEPAFADAMETHTAYAVDAATRLITISEATRRDVVAHYDVSPDHVHAVPLGVDHAVFEPGLPGGSEMVGRATGGGSPGYVLFVGVLHPRKNLVALRTALAAVRGRGTDHVLAVVGTEALDRKDNERLVAEAGAPLADGSPVAYFSGVDEPALARLMAGASAFCLPSLHEGFGLPVLEAMACGTPVVVSDRGALPELVGDAGVIAEPRADAMEEGLFRVLTDASVAEALAQRGIERARGYSWESTAHGWLDVLRAAALPEPPGRLTRLLR